MDEVKKKDKEQVPKKKLEIHKEKQKKAEHKKHEEHEEHEEHKGYGKYRRHKEYKMYEEDGLKGDKKRQEQKKRAHYDGRV